MCAFNQTYVRRKPFKILFNQILNYRRDKQGPTFQCPAVLGLDVDQSTGEQKGQHVVDFLAGEQTFRGRLRLERNSNL